MTQMIPEALPVRVDVEPVAYIDVVVTGPYDLKATLHIPDGEEVWDVLNEFVTALPQAIGEGLQNARDEVDHRADYDTSGPAEVRWSDESARDEVDHG